MHGAYREGCGLRPFTLDRLPSLGENTALEIDVLYDGSCDTLAVDNALDLTDLSLKINDPSRLNPNMAYVIARATSCTGAFRNTNLPAHWNVRWNDGTKCLTLACQRGTVIMLLGS